jgi:hypothetical protein
MLKFVASSILESLKKVRYGLMYLDASIKGENLVIQQGTLFGKVKNIEGCNEQVQTIYNFKHWKDAEIKVGMKFEYHEIVRNHQLYIDEEVKFVFRNYVMAKVFQQIGGK